MKPTSVHSAVGCLLGSCPRVAITFTLCCNSYLQICSKVKPKQGGYSAIAYQTCLAVTPGPLHAFGKMVTG